MFQTILHEAVVWPTRVIPMSNLHQEMTIWTASASAIPVSVGWKWSRRRFRPEAVEQAVKSEMRFLSEEFWEVEWTSKGLDTQAGRAILVDSILQISRNMKAGIPWFADVALVDSSQYGLRDEGGAISLS